MTGDGETALSATVDDATTPRTGGFTRFLGSRTGAWVMAAIAAAGLAIFYIGGVVCYDVVVSWQVYNRLVVISVLTPLPFGVASLASAIVALARRLPKTRLDKAFFIFAIVAGALTVLLVAGSFPAILPDGIVPDPGN